MNDFFELVRKPIHFTIKGWAALVLLLAFATAIGVGVTLYGNQAHSLVEEVAARQESGRADRIATDYAQCVKGNATLGVLRNVVSTAYTGTVTVTPKQIAALPAKTRELLAELEPLLKVSANSTTLTKAAVLATIPVDEKCVVPPGVVVTPTTTLATTTTRPR